MPWFKICLAVAGTLAMSLTYAAQDPLYSLTEENHSIFTHQDRHYVQGLMFTRTAVPQADSLWQGLDNDFGRVAGWLGAGPAVEQHYQWPIIGQSIFTPEARLSPVPDPRDEPYAGWLYLGAGLTQRDAGGRTDHLQLLLGVVGPWALGKPVMNNFHHIFGYGPANGWSHQLHSEPGLLVGYSVNWDLPLPQLGPISADFLPGGGITAGNVLTYGAVNATLRVGQGLAAGDTPRTITPGLSGTGTFDPSRLDGFMGWFIYGGVQERAVWRNIFLQGNSWRDSPSVPMKHFVTDENVGVAFMFRFGLRVDITYIKRSKEFFGQNGDDRIGSVTLSAPL